MSIKENITKVKTEVPSMVTIVAATKTRSVEEIKEAIDGDIHTIGENYVNEAEEKFKFLEGKAKIHCIGHLQTNKVKKAVEIFDMIQTVDSFKIAKEVDKRCKHLGKIMDVLIEVNSGEEPNKDGCMPNDVEPLIRKASSLKHIKIKGLMTMAPYFDDPEKTRPCFSLTSSLFDEINEMNIDNVHMEILSMGMSNSYAVAIEEGANMVRIGTGIFGERD